MRNPRQLLRALLCLALALLAGGCTTATSALWDRQKDHPADRPLIRLAYSPQQGDILVRYNEQLNKSTIVAERAYWLFASANSSATRKPPVFADDANLDHLQVIPVFQSKNDLKHLAPVGYSAFAIPTDCKFELCQDGKQIRRYRLPNYSRWGDVTSWRVALTPLAVTGDAALTLGATAWFACVASNGQVIPLALALAHR
jgi:hypothetical protein